MHRRQHMEKYHPEIFCQAEFVKELLADFRIDLTMVLSTSFPASWRSHMRGLQVMRTLRTPILTACSCWRWRRSSSNTQWGPSRRPSSTLRCSSILYCHAKTGLFKLTATPTGDAVRMYGSRGWCLCERMLADLLSPPHLSLDISKFKDRETEDSFREQKCTASRAFGTAAGAEKSTEELAKRKQSDQRSAFFKLHGCPTLTAMTKAGRGPLVEHEGLRRRGGEAGVFARQGQGGLHGARRRRRAASTSARSSRRRWSGGVRLSLLADI